MKVVDVSSSRKPMIGSKVESTSRSKGKEVLWDPMPVSKNEKSDSMETEDEISIQYGTLPSSNFSGQHGIHFAGNLQSKVRSNPYY